MFAGLMHLLGFTRYQRKSHHVTLWYMMKGLMPWVVLIMAGAIVTIILLLITQTVLIPFVVMAPWTGVWIGGIVAWMSSIQNRISLLAASRRIFATEIDLPDNKKLGFISILQEQPKAHETQSEKNNGKVEKYIEIPVNAKDKDEKRNIDILRLKDHLVDGNSKLKIPVNTFNYDLNSLYFLTIPRLGVDADKVVVSVKDKWEDLPLTEEAIPIPYANWYGHAVIPILNLTYMMSYSPDGLKGSQTVLLKDRRDVSQQNVDDYHKRMGLVSQEHREALALIAAPLISKNITLENEVSQKNIHIDGLYTVTERYKKDRTRRDMETATQRENLRNLGKPLLTKKRFLVILILLSLGLLGLWILGVI